MGAEDWELKRGDRVMAALAAPGGVRHVWGTVRGAGKTMVTVQFDEYPDQPWRVERRIIHVHNRPAKKKT